ncbi:MAG: pantoate kinase [Halanaeroarchaeum sp.]
MCEDRAARAFVPGHVTGFFSVHRTDDPATTGSRGAGLTLERGVTVEVCPADSTTIRLDGDPVDVAAVEGVLDGAGVTARVAATTDLPLGSGFGVSGAMALGTALAANEVFGWRRSANALVRRAHEAEVAAGTGLGDVVAQARGGAPIRLEPGAPPAGALDAIPQTATVEYLDIGELSTADVLAERHERITEAGVGALDRLRETPTLDRFVDLSREFAEDVGLRTGTVDEVISAVEEAGGSAAMAMLGRTVFALGSDLTAAGYDPKRTAIHPGGATLLADSTPASRDQMD